MVGTDTPQHVRQRVVGVFGEMSGAERVRLATDMADEAREIAIAGIRARHPGSDDRFVQVAWLRLLHGDVLADEIARCSSSS